MALETDPHRLEQRQKQIDFGLATTGYANYVAWLKSNKGRVKPIPIPNIYIKCSKRSWDGQIRHWRRLLHLWDAIEPPTGSPHDRHFQDPCERENIEYTDMDVGLLPEPTSGSARASSSATQRVESPSPLLCASQETFPTDSPAQIRRSRSDEFASVYSPHHPCQMPRPHHSPMQQHQQQQLMPHPVPMHMHAPHPHQYQMPSHLIPSMPHSSMAPLGYAFPPLPSPGWVFVPAGYPGMPPMYPPAAEEAVSAELLLLTEQEDAARRRLLADHHAALQTILHQQYLGALKAASAAQTELARHRHPMAAEPPHAWPEATLGFRLLQDDFGAGSHCELPPSLSEAAPRRTSLSPSAAAAAARPLNPFPPRGEAEGEDDKYCQFRRHFQETPGTGRGSLESPPQCWSPAHHLTPAFSTRGSSSTPGLTPSPSDWLPAQRSPLPTSPRTALAFADWASPTAGQPPKDAGLAPGAGDPALHLWPPGSSSP